MSHYKVNRITRWLSHKNKSRLHGVLQLVGGSMVLLGALGKFSQKDVHFNTWHGRFGACAHTFHASVSTKHLSLIDFQEWPLPLGALRALLAVWLTSSNPNLR